MTPFLNQFAFMSSEQHERPYLTFPVAIETGALTNPDDKAKVIDTSLGVILANGHIPNAQGAGLVDLGDEIIAFDHVAIDVEADDKIRISPTSKSEVSTGGQIMEEGAIVLQNKSGLLKFVAFAIDAYRRPWLADKLSHNTHNMRRLAGKTAVFNAPPFVIPDYEIIDVDINTKSVLVKPRIKYS